jgi:hypothetical protein
MLIGICGLINSGKDTIANTLINEYSFKKDSFASSLKDVLSILFNWDRSLLEGDTEESRNWRNQVDTWWSDKLNISDFTPRKAMQLIGTDCIRDYFHNNIWVYTVLKRLENNKENENIVITDCRFPSEINAIREKGGIIIRVIRNLPIWYSLALDASHGCKQSIQKCNDLNIHVSEYGHLSIKEDYTLYNDGNIDQLQDKIRNLMSSLMK